MILTNCAACAAPLSDNAPRCIRCQTRYCDSTCQHDHWRRGHKQMCKKIHRGGNAEQYNADKKYKEAVAVAVEKCADDTKGQTCYICTQALHWKTKEGLVRMCACRGTAGFAHVSCLVEQAKILCEEAYGNDLGEKRQRASWMRWSECSLCEQQHCGVVQCALGWGAWKTYVGRSEEELQRGALLKAAALSILGLGLHACGRPADAIIAYEAEAKAHRRYGIESNIETLTNLSVCYADLGQHEKVLDLRRDIYYTVQVERSRVSDVMYFTAATNVVDALQATGLFDESKTLLHDMIPEARRTLGPEAFLTLCLRRQYVSTFIHQGITGPRRIIPLADVREGIALLEDLLPIYRRVFGSTHPETKKVLGHLVGARKTALQLANLPTTSPPTVKPSARPTRAPTTPEPTDRGSTDGALPRHAFELAVTVAAAAFVAYLVI